jgi:diguanylate cyclase (GGDEF)-like protein/PAS domain S-box-containing protein
LSVSDGPPAELRHPGKRSDQDPMRKIKLLDAPGPRLLQAFRGSIVRATTESAPMGATWTSAYPVGMPWPPSVDEAHRLERLRALAVLDTAPEPVFDTLVQLASDVCSAPIALLSLVDAERQWFKANAGLPGVNETHRDLAFCDHAIRGDGLFEVPDASADPRFKNNPLVTGSPEIRFYAGAPLVMAGGERIGTLCIIDRQARHLTPAQAQLLTQLARVAVQALEMRHNLLDRSLAVRSEHERSITTSEARLRALLDTQSELVSQATPDGRLLYLNPAYAAHVGLAVEAIIGTNLLDYVEPADREAVRERIATVIRTGQVLTAENRMSTIDGQERWISWTNARQIDAEGVLLLHSTGRDVSARVRVERALRSSQDFLARTERVAGVGGWELDIASGTVSWSDETRRIHEVPMDFTPTLANAVGFYAPAARPRIEKAIGAALATGCPWDLELPLITARGRPIWARVVGEVEFADATAVRLVGAFQDITERHALQESVAGNERFLRALTDSLPVRMAYLDRDRRYRFVNEAWLSRLGIQRDQAIGHTRAELLPDEDDVLMSQRAGAALAGEAQHFEFDEIDVGRVRRIENRLIPDRTDAGEVRGFFVTGIDITERSQAEKALRELAAIFDNTPDYVVQTDRRGQVIYMNPAARLAVGLSQRDPIDHFSFADFNTPDTNRLYAEVIMPALARGEVWLGQSTVYLAGRREVPVSHMVLAHRDAEGRIERYSALMRDISAAVLREQEVARQSATLRSVADAIPATVAVLDSAGKYRFVNRAFAASRGLLPADILGQPARSILGEEEFGRRKPHVDRVQAGERVSFELNHETREGIKHTALEYIPLQLAAGGIDGFVEVTQDITQQKREQARLRIMSETDSLTGLLNRSGFEDRLANMLDETAAESLTIFYVDLDRFKPVNDTYGHAAGDELLKVVARRLVRLVRPTDAVARLGGDEFAVLLPGVKEAGHAERIAQDIVDAASLPFTLSGGIEVQIGASVGGAVGHALRGNWQQLLKVADRMLYEAKGAGRNRYVIEAELAPPQREILGGVPGEVPA